MQMNETIEQLMARHEAVFAAWMELVEAARGTESRFVGQGIVLRKNGELWMLGNDVATGARVVELRSRPGSLDVERLV
jgi:hypothetical protein